MAKGILVQEILRNGIIPKLETNLKGLKGKNTKLMQVKQMNVWQKI